MSRPILSISLIIISVIAFFSFIDPTYKEVQVLEAENSQFDEALTRSKELQSIRDELLSRYNTFSTEDLNRIEKLLPDNVDNVRLILDLDSIASKYGMLIKDVSISNEQKEVIRETVQMDDALGEIGLNFRVTSPYPDFKKFISDLEQSLRIVDISALSFKASDNSSGLIDFSVSIKTYWLK